MPNIKEQLKKLQEIRHQIISKMNKNFSNKSSQKDFIEKLKNIEIQIAKLNKLEDSEINLHTIWIGILPKAEFDNIKLWAKYNPDYRIHLWIDSNHVLTPKLNSLIFANSKKANTKKYNHQIEADLKDEFYQNYQLQNPNNSFDENAKQFLLNKGYALEKEILNWLNAGKEKIHEAVEEIKKYTDNEVILHDVAIEKDNIFPSTKYYEGYLKTLEHLHICAGASDRLRYAILNKYGGVYIDTDLMPNFNLEEIKNNQKINNLINTVKWKDFYEFQHIWRKRKSNIIINQIITLDKLEQLNDEKLSDFAIKWKEKFGGDLNKNVDILKNIAEEYKNMDLTLNPMMYLSNYPIKNYHQTEFFAEQLRTLVNGFICSKQNSKFLHEVMKKIETTDNKIKDMNTYEKLLNKTEMIMYHTGPKNFKYTALEFDSYYWMNFNQYPNIFNISTMNSFISSWFNPELSKDTINNFWKLKSLFWSNKEETEKYFMTSYSDSKKVQKKYNHEHEVEFN